jgi:hypothetical protein
MTTQNSVLFKVPLEIRQAIYGFASERPTGSRLILKEYLEKVDNTIPRLPPVAPAAPTRDKTLLGDREDGGQEEEEQDHGAYGIVANSSAQCSYGRLTKYRHILPIIQLNSSPPPKSLLQACRQLNTEAIEYHRNRCVLTIDVNKGFEHFSMYNETMNMLIDSTFSPLEHIRKVHLVITWDSEWLREKSTPPGGELETDQMFFFGFFFGERLQTMINLLKACPELRKVTIDYHDTEDTPESRTFMVEKLMDLHATITGKTWINEYGASCPVELEVHEYFSAANTVHAGNSLLALRRTEFDRFLGSGLIMR